MRMTDYTYPECGARPDEPCVGTDGSYHAARWLRWDDEEERCADGWATRTSGLSTRAYALMKLTAETTLFRKDVLDDLVGGRMGVGPRRRAS